MFPQRRTSPEDPDSTLLELGFSNKDSLKILSTLVADPLVTDKANAWQARLQRLQSKVWSAGCYSAPSFCLFRFSSRLAMQGVLTGGHSFVFSASPSAAQVVQWCGSLLQASSEVLRKTLYLISEAPVWEDSLLWSTIYWSLPKAKMLQFILIVKHQISCFRALAYL